MRQTLFYITLNTPFSWLPEGTAEHPILHVGIGVLMLFVLIVMGLWHLVKSWRTGATAASQGLQPLLWNAGQLLMLGVLLMLFSPMRIFPVYGYGTMLLVSFIAGASWAGRRAVSVGMPRELVWDAAMLILISGIIGARLFYLIQHGDRVFAEVSSLPEFLMATVNLSEGGLVLYGGIILGTIAYFAFCALRKVHPLQLADVITPSIFLGLGFGRLGCLLNGCCFGDRCELPWAITFPEGSPPYVTLLQLGFISAEATSSLPLHPSQIYSSLGGFLFAFVTAVVFKHRRKVGEVLGVGAVLYPVNRFLIEFVRGDEFTQFDTGLTISQLVSLGVLAAAIAYLVWLEGFSNSPDIAPSPPA